MNFFFEERTYYQNFSLEHGLAMLFFILLWIYLVRSHRHLDLPLKMRTSIILSFIPLLALLIRMILDASIRPLTLADDLPLHLCRILSLIAPIIVWFGGEKSSKIFYYMVLAGTLNAMITADIEFGFPHYAYIMYWVYHGFLVTLAIYNVIVFKIHLGLKEGLISFFIVNVYFIILHLINLSIDSNYMYSRSKPASASIMDLLGEWPVYIFWLEIIAFLMIMFVHLVMGRLLIPSSSHGDSNRKD